MDGRYRTEIRRTILLLLALLLMLDLNAASFSFGGEAGVTIDSVIAGSGYNDYQISPSAGFRVAVPMIVRFNEHVGLKTGIAFLEKNYDYDRYVNAYRRTYHTNDLTRINGFVEVPFSLLLLLPLDSSSSTFLSFGGFCGYWIYARQEGYVLNSVSYDDDAVDSSTDLSYYNRLQYGLLLSLGVDVVYERMTAVLALEYALSLSDMNKRQKYGSYPMYNSAFTLSFGIMWGKL